MTYLVDQTPRKLTANVFSGDMREGFVLLGHTKWLVTKTSPVYQKIFFDKYYVRALAI